MPLPESNIKDIIYLYIDGQATDAESKVLFDMLPSDPSIKEEFDSAMKLDKAITYDKEILTPTPELTDKLFQKAGFAVPNARPVPAPIFGEAVKNIISNVAAGVVALSILYSGYNFFNQIHRNADSIKSQKYQSEVIEKYLINKPHNAKSTDIPVASSIKTEDNKFTTFIKNKITKQNNGRNTNINKGTNIITDYKDDYSNPLLDDVAGADNNIPGNNDLAENSQNNNLPVENNTYKIDNSFMNTAYNLNYKLGINTDLYSPLAAKKPSDLNLIIELRGMQSTNFYPNRPIQTSNEFSNNFLAAVRYQISYNQSMGIVGGVEDLQMYEVVQEGKKFKFDLNSSLYWVGMNYKYIFNPISDILPIRPYAETAIGGSKFGPVTKLAAGISYDFMNNFTIGLGYEFTSLMYTEISTYRFTHKSGFNYSISYKL